MTEASVDGLIADGHALEDRGELAAALARYEEAARVAPKSTRAQINLGNVLAKLGRFDDAEAAYSRAIDFAPDEAHARFNLATLVATRGDLARSESLLRDALRVQPSLAEASVALAELLASSGRVAEAETHLRSALGYRPGYPGAAHNLGMLLAEQDRFDEAVEQLALAPKVAPHALGSIVFRQNDRSDLDARELYRRHAVVGAVIARRAGPRFTRWANAPDPERPLAIGYVSSDFKLHPIGLFMRPLLEQHDRRSFAIHCYATNSDTDAVTDVLRQLAPHWHDISRVPSDALAERVRDDGIDILVDLSGYTNNNRLAVFARHPAPVQATWLGYLNTTGISAVDYRICDRHTDPEGETDPYCTERLVRLPHSQWCYSAWWAPPDRTRATSDPEQLRFGSVNRHTKISDTCAELWAGVLRQVPDAVLSIVDVPDGQRGALLDRFAARGIDASRVALSGRLSSRDYYALIGDLDVALDTFPYNGATTTLDTLWMGTPLVALRGDRPAARSSTSILRSLGMPELVAETAAEYVDINLKLARDGAWRDRLRLTLRERLLASPLMDAPGFVRDLEACYRTMWRAWCSRRG